MVNVGSAEAFEVPSGFHVSAALSNGELLLLGDSVAVWAPQLQEQRTIWPHATQSVSPVPKGWGLDLESVLVEDERSGVHQRVVVPLGGSAPFGLFGGHASTWAYYGNGNILVGLTPDFELVRYDRTTEALEIIAPKIVDATYFAEDLERGQPSQLIFEVGDLDDAGGDREFWAMPLPD